VDILQLFLNERIEDEESTSLRGMHITLSCSSVPYSRRPSWSASDASDGGQIAVDWAIYNPDIVCEIFKGQRRLWGHKGQRIYHTNFGGESTCPKPMAAILSEVKCSRCTTRYLHSAERHRKHLACHSQSSRVCQGTMRAFDCELILPYCILRR
jgi:hypothetical protein